MRHGHDARRFCLLATAMLLMHLTNTAKAAMQANRSDSRFETLRVADIAFEFVRIPAGRFAMGSSSGETDERPAHDVSIDYESSIGKTEVTVRQFRAFAEATGYTTVGEREGTVWHMPSPDNMKWARGRHWRDPGFEQTDDHPVVCISYLDATAFCAWLSAQSGQPIRLPTEAEWEYACRAGTTGDYAGPFEEMAWFNATSGERPHPVAQKAPNAWGLYDMHGNAAEWCEDMCRWSYRDAPADGSANALRDVPAAAVVRRVLRGGSWRMQQASCRSSFRCPAPQALRATDTGFRIVRCNRPAAQGASTSGHRQAALAVATRALKDDLLENAPAKLALDVDGIAFDFARIDPGRFTMGSPHSYVDEYDWTYEMPAHEVTISRAYYMGVTEVTVEQFRLFTEQTGYITDAEKQGWAYSPDDDYWHFEHLVDWRGPGYVQTDREPVVCLGWYDAVAFCRWLGEKTGRDFRLPSEAEWEYACRAGTTGDNAGSLDAMAWYTWNSGTRTHAVARKQPNAWGLYDMHGNAWEWVQDLYHRDCTDAPTDGSAWLETTDVDPRGITRGGSFYNPEWLCRSYIRMQTSLGYKVHVNNGFRLACDMPQLQNQTAED